MSMGTRRWLNQTQPQTLQIAVFLMYLDAGFIVLTAVLYGVGFDILSLLLLAGYVAAGYGIANERKWGYWLGVAIAGFFLALALLSLAGFSLVHIGLLGLVFAVAKFALLVHPMSREYQRIWFK